MTNAEGVEIVTITMRELRTLRERDAWAGRCLALVAFMVGLLVASILSRL